MTLQYNKKKKRTPLGGALGNRGGKTLFEREESGTEARCNLSVNIIDVHLEIFLVPFLLPFCDFFYVYIKYFPIPIRRKYCCMTEHVLSDFLCVLMV